MSGLLKSVFGGSDSEQQSQQTAATVDKTPEELAAIRGPFADALKGLLNNQGRPAYTGQLTTELGAGESRALGQVDAAANDAGRQGLLADTISGKFLGSNPYLQKAIEAAQRPTLEGLSTTLTRDLPGRFTANGQFVQPQGSSAFDRAAAVATKGAANALGDIATNISYQGYEGERGRQQQAISLSQNELQGAVTNLQAQALPRLIQEQGIERGLQEFQSRFQSFIQALQIAAGSPVAVQGQVSQGTSSGSSSAEKGIVPGLFPKGI